MNQLKKLRTSIVITTMLALTYYSVDASHMIANPCDTVSYDFTSPDVTLCYNGACASLESIGEFEHYQWSTGDITASIIVCEAGNYALTVTDSAGCTGVGGFTVVAASDTPPSVWVEFCVGDSVEVNGDYYSLPGTYLDTVGTYVDCSSLLFVHVSEIPLTVISITHSLCAGDSLFVAGTWITQPGTYDFTAESSGIDCDTIITVVIIEEPYNTESISLSFCSGDSAWFNEQWYSYSGIYTDTIPSSTDACDTLVTITITEDPLIPKVMNLSICSGDSVWIYGKWYFDFGPFYDTISSVTGGCDTTVTISISESPYNSRVISMSMCLGDSMYYNGVLYTDFGSYIDTISSQTGSCDTVVVITISESPHMLPISYFSICNNDSIPCFYQWCYESGIYHDTIAGIEDDCDTILTIDLTVDMPTPISFTITPDAGTSSGSISLEDTSDYTYIWNTGEVGTAIYNLTSGEYTVKVTSVDGCENIITYTVTGPFDDLDDIVSNDKFEVYPNPFLNDFSLTVPDTGNDATSRIIVVNYLGQLVYSSDAKRDQPLNIGSTFQTGIYFVFLINQEEVLASARVIKTD